MRQGWLWLMGLLCTLAIAPTGFAQVMTYEQRDHWLDQMQLVEKAQELMGLFEQNHISSLEMALQGLAYPQQEVIRYLLLRQLQQSHYLLSDEMETFISKQRLLAPQYYVVEKGHGFEFTSPAFDYPALAIRLVKQRHNEQRELTLNLSIHQHQLNLKQWLGGEPERIDENQALLAKVIPSLSSQEIAFLADQIKQQGVVSWLPANQVLIELAKVSRDRALYKLLWLKRADLYTEKEVERLAQVADDFSIEQLILACRNPRLKRQAQEALVALFPMTDVVKQFLVEQMSQSSDVTFVATHLIEHGYRSWLEALVQENRQVKTSLLQQVLAQ